MDDDPTPPTSSRAIHLLVAWVLILGVAGAMVAMTQAGHEAAAEGPQPVAPGPVDTQLKAAQVAVGLHALDRDAAPPLDEVLAEQDELAAGEPLRRWRAAVVAGELGGDAIARERLAAMEMAGEGEVARDVMVLYQIYLEGGDAVAREQVLRLRQRHGWFGRLALSYGSDDDEPVRAAVRAEAIRATMVLSGLSLAAILVFIGVVVCSVLAVLRWRSGRLVWAYRADQAAGPVYASAFALYLLAFLGFSLVAALVLREAPAIGEVAIYWAFVPLLALVLAGWFRLSGVGRAEALAAVGLHRGTGWWREVGAGLVGYLAGLPLVVVGLLISNQLGGAGAEHPVMEQLTGGSPWRVVGAFLLAAGFAPLVEEIAFRGLLYHHLRTWYGPLLAALIQGLIFAVVHPQGVAAVPVLASVGILFALIREWRGSLVGPMAAHAVHNAAALSVVLLLMS